MAPWPTGRPGLKRDPGLPGAGTTRGQGHRPRPGTLWSCLSIKKLVRSLRAGGGVVPSCKRGWPLPQSTVPNPLPVCSLLEPGQEQSSPELRLLPRPPLAPSMGFELAGWWESGQGELHAAGLLRSQARSHTPVFPPPQTLSTERAHRKYLSGV